MFALLRKIWFFLKGKSNDLYENNANPEVVLRQAARELDDQRKNLRGVWTNLNTQATRHRELVEEKQAQFEENKAKAKKLRDEGNKDLALRHANRCLSLKKWIDTAEASVVQVSSRMTAIEDEINRLKFEKEDLLMEISLASSTITMSNVENGMTNAKGTSSEKVKEMLESARNRVRDIELQSASNRAAYEKFDQEESTTATSADADDFLKDL